LLKSAKHEHHKYVTGVVKKEQEEKVCSSVIIVDTRIIQIEMEV